MKVFVDTSAFYALVDEDDPNHGAAVGSLRGLQATADLLTSNYALVEAIALVRRRLQARDEERLVDDILPNVRTIWVDEATHRSAMGAYRAATRTGSFVDYVSFEVMRRKSIDVAFAYDGDFERQGFRSVPRWPTDPPERRLSEMPARYSSQAAGDPGLVSVSEIAARSGRSTNTIQSWRRRHADFPAPVAELAAGPVWTWPAVAAWVSTRTRRQPTIPLFESGIPDLAGRADDYLDGFGEQ